MPTIYVVATRPSGRKLMELVFPVHTDLKAHEYSRWHWPELQVGSSKIEGCEMNGLYPRSTKDLDWSAVPRTLCMPYLGKETEVESSVQARVLRSVLCGGVWMP